MPMALPETRLLQRIERFLAANGVGRTQFGIKSLRDPRLVLDLERGRELRSTTRARVESFMRSVEKRRAKKKNGS